MTDKNLTLYCLVDGESTLNAFPVSISSAETVGELKKLIKAEQSPDFDDIVANKLKLWKVSIPDDDSVLIVLDNQSVKTQLKATSKLSKVFETELEKNTDLPEDTIHIIVQRPPQVHAPVPSRALTPLPGSLSDGSRPSSPLSGDLHTDIKKITDKFFAPGSDVAKFLDAFVKGQGALPMTTGPIRGLPSAWRRGFGRPPDTLSFI